MRVEFKNSGGTIRTSKWKTPRHKRDKSLPRCIQKKISLPLVRRFVWNFSVWIGHEAVRNGYCSRGCDRMVESGRGELSDRQPSSPALSIFGHNPDHWGYTASITAFTVFPLHNHLWREIDVHARRARYEKHSVVNTSSTRSIKCFRFQSGWREPLQKLLSIQVKTLCIARSNKLRSNSELAYLNNRLFISIRQNRHSMCPELRRIRIMRNQDINQTNMKLMCLDL